MAGSRPYFITYAGRQRLVEAPTPAAAVQHVVGSAVTELRSAKGSEVSAWVRNGKRIETAGEVDVEGRDELLEQQKRADGLAEWLREATSREDAAFDATDARVWLIFTLDHKFEHGSEEMAASLAVWDRMRERDSMTIDDYGLLSEVCPEFAVAMHGDDEGGTIESFTEPMPFSDVVDLIAAQKRRENFEEPAGEDKMVGDTGHIDT